MSLVAEWQMKHEAVRAIWRLEDIIKLILRAISGSEEVRKHIEERDGRPISDAQLRPNLIHTLTYFLDALRRLRTATDGILRVVSMFESEGYQVESAKNLHDQQAVIPAIIEDVEPFLENLEWEELECTALPSATIRAVAEHLASTGQASA